MAATQLLLAAAVALLLLQLPAVGASAALPTLPQLADSRGRLLQATRTAVYAPATELVDAQPWHVCPRGYTCTSHSAGVVAVDAGTPSENVTWSEAAMLCAMSGMALAPAAQASPVLAAAGSPPAWVREQCTTTAAPNPPCNRTLGSVACQKRTASNPFPSTSEMASLSVASQTELGGSYLPIPGCRDGEVWLCPRGYTCDKTGDYVFLRASSDDSRLNGVEAAAVCTLNCMAPVQASIVERIVNELNSGNAVPELPDEIYALQSVVSNTCTALQNRSGTFAEVDAACEVLLGGTVCLADPKAIEYVTNPQKALDDAEALLRERLRADVYNPATEFWNGEAWWACPRGYQCHEDGGYVLVDVRTRALTGIEATALCKVSGMEATQPTLQADLPRVDALRAQAFGAGVDAAVWLGANDRAAEGAYVDASNQPLTATAWLAGEPDLLSAAAEDCTVFHGVSAVTGWATRRCGELMDGVLCKKPSNNAMRYVGQASNLAQTLVADAVEKFAASLPGPASDFVRENNAWWACVNATDGVRTTECFEDGERGTRLVAVQHYTGVTWYEATALCEASGMVSPESLDANEREVAAQLMYRGDASRWGFGKAWVAGVGLRDASGSHGSVQSNAWVSGEPKSSPAVADPACAELLSVNLTAYGAGGYAAVGCMDLRSAVLCRKKEGAVGWAAKANDAVDGVVGGVTDAAKDQAQSAADKVDNLADSLPSNVPGVGGAASAGAFAATVVAVAAALAELAAY